MRVESWTEFAELLRDEYFEEDSDRMTKRSYLEGVNVVAGAFTSFLDVGSILPPDPLLFTRCCLAMRVTVSSTLFQSFVKPFSVFLSPRSKRSMSCNVLSADCKKNLHLSCIKKAFLCLRQLFIFSLKLS